MTGCELEPNALRATFKAPLMPHIDMRVYCLGIDSYIPGDASHLLLWSNIYRSGPGRMRAAIKSHLEDSASRESIKVYLKASNLEE